MNKIKFHMFISQITTVFVCFVCVLFVVLITSTMTFKINDRIAAIKVLQKVSVTLTFDPTGCYLV